MINNQSAWTTGWRTFMVNIQGQSVSAPEWITKHTRARTNTPVFSPDGRYLAYVSMDRPGYEADRYHIEIYDLTSRSVRRVAYNWDRSVESLMWSTTKGKLLCTAQEDGSVKVFEIDMITGQVFTVLANYTNHISSQMTFGDFHL
jgi:Tol biopolymer transport system component